MELPEKLPDADNGVPDGSERCRCGQPQNPANKDICLGGHFWKANAKGGKSTERTLAEQHDRVIKARDHHLRDLEWTPERAPLHVVTFCQLLAEVPIAAEHTRRSGKRTTELTNLLQKAHRLFAMFETFRRRERDNEWGEATLEEMKATVVSMESEVCWLKDAIIDLQAGDADRAVRDEGQASRLPTLPTPTSSESPVDGSTSAVPTVAGAQTSGSRDLSPAPDSRASLAPRAVVSPPTERPPAIHVYNRRVTEADVRRCLADSGDLAAYDNGRISKLDAYRQTANWLRNSVEFNQ